jgi:hypothetical protein
MSKTFHRKRDWDEYDDNYAKKSKNTRRDNRKRQARDADDVDDPRVLDYLSTMMDNHKNK